MSHHRCPRRLLTGVGFVALFLVLTIPILANNPDHSHPYWYGGFGEIVDMRSGELILPVTDISIPTRGGLSLSFTRTYNSEINMPLADSTEPTSCTIPSNPKSTAYMGKGWHAPIMRIINNGATLMYGDGQYEDFFIAFDGKKKTRNFAVLEQSGNNFILRCLDGTTYTFAQNGTLSRVTDATGENWIDYTYSCDGGYPAVPVLQRMQDRAGRYIQLYFNQNPLQCNSNTRISSLEYKGVDGSAKTILYQYALWGIDSSLSSVVYPDGRTVTYTYSDQWWCNNSMTSTNGTWLLASVQFPESGKVKYGFERFAEKLQVWGDPQSYLYVPHVALRSIVLDSLGTEYDATTFSRTSSEAMTSMASVPCYDCSAGEKTIWKWDFSDAHARVPLDDVGDAVRNMIGLPKNFWLYKGPTLVDSAAYYESYNQAGHWWNLTRIGRDTSPGTPDTSIWLPYLMGVKFHRRDTTSNCYETLFKDVTIDSITGAELTRRPFGDSLFQIVDKYYDATLNRLYIKKTHYDSFDTKYIYPETGGIPTSMLPTAVQRLAGDTLQIGISYSYDNYGNVYQVSDKYGLLSTTAYDASTSTFPAQVIDERKGLTTLFDYDLNTGLLKSTTGPTGLRISFQYDASGRLIAGYRKPSDQDSVKLLDIAYDPDQRTVTTHRRIGSGANDFDWTKSVATIWGQAGEETVYNLSESQHSVSERRYNRAGQLSGIRRPYFTGSPDNLWTTYRYDYLGRVVEVDAPNTTNDDNATANNKTTYSYVGRQVYSTDWSGVINKVVRDRYGRVVGTFADSTGTTWAGGSTSTTYLGITDLPLTTTNPTSNTISYTYDKWRKLSSAQKPDEGTQLTYVSKYGNLRFHKRNDGLWTILCYDDLYRLATVSTKSNWNIDVTKIETLDWRPTGDSLRIKYCYGQYSDNLRPASIDTLKKYYNCSSLTAVNSHDWIKGKLTQVIDEADTTLFIYDAYGRVFAKYIQFNRFVKFINPVVTFQPGPKMMYYDYTAGDMLAGIRYPDQVPWINYRYNSAGLLKNVGGFVVASPTDSITEAVTYTPWASEATMLYKNGTREVVQYDDVSRVMSDHVALGSSPSTLFGESYKYRNQHLTQVYNDPSMATNFGSKITEYSYDRLGRVHTANYLAFGEVAQYTYSYDNSNRRTAVQKGLLSTSYNYYPDKPGELRYTGATARNLYLYDTNGNTIADSVKGLTYAVNYLNMIDTVYHASTACPGKRDTVVYAYNYKNQRVVKLYKYWYRETVNCPGSTMMGGESGDNSVIDGGGPDPDPEPEPSPYCDIQVVGAVFYIWSGNQVVAEHDINGAWKNRYVHANGKRVMQIRWPQDTFYVHSDYLGSQRLMTSRTGAILDKVYYDIWGQRRWQAGEGYDKYRWIDGQDDEFAWENHYYLKNRYYNPSIGRFLTPDPYFTDFSPYGYCRGNPVEYKDPEGLYDIGPIIAPPQTIWGYRIPSLASAAAAKWARLMLGGQGQVLKFDPYEKHAEGVWRAFEDKIRGLSKLINNVYRYVPFLNGIPLATDLWRIDQNSNINDETAEKRKDKQLNDWGEKSLAPAWDLLLSILGLGDDIMNVNIEGVFFDVYTIVTVPYNWPGDQTDLWKQADSLSIWPMAPADSSGQK